MLQTIVVSDCFLPNKNINIVIDILEKNNCTVKNIKVISRKEYYTYQILFESEELINCKFLRKGKKSSIQISKKMMWF